MKIYKCTKVQKYNDNLAHMFSSQPDLYAANMQMYKCAYVQMCKCANVQMCQCTNVQMYKYANEQIYNCAIVKKTA